MQFGPGDTLLLARGGEWNQELTLSGSGADDAYAVLGAYGEGPRPKILRDGEIDQVAVRALDPSYWRYEGLEIGNAGAGLLVYYTTLRHQGLEFSDIFVHDVNGWGWSLDDPTCSHHRMMLPAGIGITGDLPPFSSRDWAVRDVTMRDIEGTHNVDSVSIEFCNGIGSTQFGPGPRYPGNGAGALGGAGWAFESRAGIEVDGAAFGDPAAPEGVQAAFVDGSASGLSSPCFSRSIDGFAAGVPYSVSFAAAQSGRTVPRTQSIEAWLDDTSLGTFTPGRQFGRLTTKPVELAAGAHTLRFCGTGSAIAFIDDVQINGPDGSSGPAVANAGFEAPALSGPRSWLDTSFALTTDGDDGHTLVRDVLMEGLYLHDDDGGGRSPACSDAVRINNTTNLTLRDSRLINEASCFTTRGTATVIVSRSRNVRFINNVFADTPNTGSPDQGGVDQEMHTRDTRYWNNAFINNAGPAIEIPANWGCENQSFDTEIASNLFVNNATAYEHFGGAIHRWAACMRPTGTITNSLYHEPTGLLGGDFTTAPGDFSFDNNRSVEHETSAPYDFSGTQGFRGWSYQYSADEGETWSDLQYDAETERWLLPRESDERCLRGGERPFIGRFVARPPAGHGCLIARVWTAPSTGTISLRARAINVDTRPDRRAGARITRNDTILWGREVAVAGDGAVADLDNVTVAAGDQVRFALDAGSADNRRATTSWAPAIAYPKRVSVSVDPDSAIVEAGTNERFTVAIEGFAPDNLSGTVTAMVPEGLAADPKSQNFSIPSDGRNVSTSFPIDVNVAPDAAPGLYMVEFVAETEDGARATTSAEIRVMEVVHRWEFENTGDPEGWTPIQQLTPFEVADGVLMTRSTGADPFMAQGEPLALDLSSGLGVEIRMETSVSSTGQVFWTTSTSESFSEDKSARFTVEDGGMRVYRVEIPAQGADLTRLRLDPLTAEGDIRIDAIRILR